MIYIYRRNFLFLFFFSYDGNYDLIKHHDPSIVHHQSMMKSPGINDAVYESRQMKQVNNMKSPDPSSMRMRLENNKSPAAHMMLRQHVRSPFPPDGQYPQDGINNILQPEDIYNVNPSRENILRAPQRFNDEYNNSQQLYVDQNERDKELYMQRLAHHQQQQLQLQQQQQLLQQQQQQQQKYPSQIGSSNIMGNSSVGGVGGMYPNAAERRTPDTYGRSRQSQGQPQDRRNFSDYEDIYNLAAQQNQVGGYIVGGGGGVDLGAYRRPMSPVGYDNDIRQNLPNMPLRYTPNFLEVGFVSTPHPF